MAISLPSGYQSPYGDDPRAPVDTGRFAKPGPWKLGLSAGYLTNAWVVFSAQHIKFQAARSPDFDDEVIETDAGFDAAKQASDIQDLITRGVDAIIYWPVDQQAILPALKAAEEAGIPTVNFGGGFADLDGVTTNLYIDQYRLGVVDALHLMGDLGGRGKILSMLPIAGVEATVHQQQALNDVLKHYPDVELLDTQNGDWDRAKSKTIAENWLQSHPDIDGIFSPSSAMSLGIGEAFAEAGRLESVMFSPADEYNGWLLFLQGHPSANAGVVTYPPFSALDAVDLAGRIVRGESVPRGIAVDQSYIEPQPALTLADSTSPEDWWPNVLPPDFLP